MPHYAYRVEGVPARAMAAAMPVPTTNSIASSWGLVHVAGAPGTTRIPSPRAQSTRGYGALGVPGNGAGYPEDWPQPSGHSPDYILPDLYVAAPTPNYGQDHINSSNEIPVPAISSHQPYAPFSATAPGHAVNPNVLQRIRTRVASGYTTAWPKVAPSWPVFGGGQS